MYGGPADRGRADDIRPYRSGGGRTRVGQASRRASPSPGQLSGRKKALSSPVTGRKRPAFVVPPMFRAELRSLCPSVAGREPRPSPGPLVGPSPAPLPRTLSADGVLSVAVDVAVLAPSGRFCLTIVSQTGKKVNPYSSQAGEKSTSPELSLFCWRVTTGFGSVSSSPPAVVSCRVPAGEEKATAGVSSAARGRVSSAV